MNNGISFAFNLSMLKITIIGKNNLFNEALAFRLSTYNNSIIETINFDNIKISNIENSDVLIIDLMMINSDLSSLLSTIKTYISANKYIIIDNPNNKNYLKKIKLIDVDAYISSIDGIFEIENALNAISHNQKYYSPIIIKCFSENIKETYNKSEYLTRREIEIMRLIAYGKSTKDIAFELSNSESTIWTHRNRILKKLNVKNVAGIIDYFNKNF